MNIRDTNLSQGASQGIHLYLPFSLLVTFGRFLGYAVIVSAFTNFVHVAWYTGAQVSLGRMSESGAAES